MDPLRSQAGAKFDGDKLRLGVNRPGRLAGSLNPLDKKLREQVTAKAVLMPISPRKQLIELPDEVATRVAGHFYSDVGDALLKALVE